MQYHRRLLAATVVCLGVTTPNATAQYDTLNVNLYEQITLSEFSRGAGNDCWGYVSPSGREYALMGLERALAVVEITDPSNPVIIERINHSSSIWGDVKVYEQYAYVSNESGGGIDVIDLGSVDSGVVTLVRRMTSNNVQESHNVAVDEESGFLYLLGSNINGGSLVAFDLNGDPSNPTFAGEWNGNYVHDAQIVTYTTGQYAGRQIAFCCDGDRGFEIVDVTDKSNMFRLSRSTYPGLRYCHQGWLSADRQYFYMNDEADELSGAVATTRTLVWDVSDLSNPFLADTFTSGLGSTDHNLYVRDGVVYEANYSSGLQIFDARVNPTSPPRIGYFDTYPANNRPGYDGAWSCYPFFPSGTVIVSDQNRGLFILDVSPAIGSRMTLDADPLVGGESTTLTVSDATPNGTVYFVYSLSGTGWTYIAALGVTLELANPALGGSSVANGAGVAVLTPTVPDTASGLTVWMQAAEVGNTSNVVEDTVQ
ncbi:MAG: choice-of-anchor B family protein [Phycisphaerales bacterium]